jgi:hypothetical protein
VGEFSWVGLGGFVNGGWWGQILNIDHFPLKLHRIFLYLIFKKINSSHFMGVWLFGLAVWYVSVLYSLCSAICVGGGHLY